jgi:hypothetical protein
MSRVSIALAVALISSLVVLDVGPAEAGSSCEQPQPVFRYTAEEAMVSLTVDFAGCQWWKGSGIEVDGELQRGFLGEGVAVSRYCGVAEWAGEGLRPPKQPRVNRCTLRLRLSHLPLEAQTYEGSFTYPWRRGTKTADFAYLCISAVQLAECRENKALSPTITAGAQR